MQSHMLTEAFCTTPVRFLLLVSDSQAALSNSKAQKEKNFEPTVG